MSLSSQPVIPQRLHIWPALFQLTVLWWPPSPLPISLKGKLSRCHCPAQYLSRNPYCPLDKIQVSQPIPAWLVSCPPLPSFSVSLTQAVLFPSWPCVKMLLHTFQLPAFDQTLPSARIYCGHYLPLVNLPQPSRLSLFSPPFLGSVSSSLLWSPRSPLSPPL